MRFLGVFLLLASVVQAASPTGQTSPPPSVASHLSEVAVERISLEFVEMSLNGSVSSTRDMKIRSISFHESSVEGVPVWIAPMETEWNLSANGESPLPKPLLGRLYFKDLLRVADLANVFRRQTVKLHSLVEIEFATPWVGRLLFMGPVQTALIETDVEVPLRTGPDVLLPLLAGVATGMEGLRNVLIPVVDAAGNLITPRKALLSEYGPSIAVVTTDYILEDPNGTQSTRSHRMLGFWVGAETFCTTREALEPWRFELSEAAFLQAYRGKLVKDSLHIRIQSSPITGNAVELDASHLISKLPKAKERKVYTPTDEKTKKISILEREDVTNVACLRFPQAQASKWLALSGDSKSAIAAFAAGKTSLELSWTEARADGRFLRQSVPLTRRHFGSPLVSENGVAGMVLSATHTLQAEAMESAVKRAVGVKVAPATNTQASAKR